MISIKKILGLGIIVFCMAACESYLAEKPSSSLAIPSTVEDFQALVDYQARMNEYYPDCGDNASDYFYLNAADWSARPEWGRDTYVWNAQADASRDWLVCYEKIFYTNTILEGIDDAALGGLNEIDRRHVKGSAFFLRGWTYLHLAPLFTPAYDASLANSPYGLPLRLTPDINAETIRSSLGDTYAQIESDLLAAIRLLPEKPVLATRPSKAAAHAALARMYLMMGQFEDALTHADLCLAIQSELMDYNTIDTSVFNSFDELNPEVIFHTELQGQSGLLAPSYARVDTSLIQLYSPGDLRLPVFYTKRPDGSWQFKGSYEGTNYTVFAGLATDEVYLIKAECMIRLGDLSNGIEVMRKLLVNRWRKGASPELNGIVDSEAALEFVLMERRRELAFRGGIRWADLKRLNKDERFAKVLIRDIDGVTYELEPNDPRYSFLIPTEVVLMSGVLQNER